jgi:hypothetical protein
MSPMARVAIKASVDVSFIFRLLQIFLILRICPGAKSLRRFQDKGL